MLPTEVLFLLTDGGEVLIVSSGGDRDIIHAGLGVARLGDAGLVLRELVMASDILERVVRPLVDGEPSGQDHLRLVQHLRLHEHDEVGYVCAGQPRTLCWESMIMKMQGSVAFWTTVDAPLHKIKVLELLGFGLVLKPKTPLTEDLRQLPLQASEEQVSRGRNAAP